MGLRNYHVGETCHYLGIYYRCIKDHDNQTAIVPTDTNYWVEIAVEESGIAVVVASGITAHEGASDPHTGYRLESADHSHASTGLQGGTVSHDDLTGVSNDDHHSKSHGHTGADGSGTVAGGDLTGTPGGELGNTWASPTVDATHSGSTHAATQAAAEATAAGALSSHAGAADPHAGYVLESLLDAKGDIIAASADNTPAKVTVGSDGKVLTADSGATGGVSWQPASGGGAPTTADYLVGTSDGGLSAEIVVGTTPGGELGGTWGSPTVDATHAGGTHLALGTTPSTQAFGDSATGGAATTASKNDHKHGMPAAAVVHADVQTFTSGSGNWTKPSGYTFARIILIGQGGGGGSGRFAAAGTNRGGGGGGAGGQRIVIDVPLAALGASEAYSCLNTGGVGGAAVTGAVAGTVAGVDGTAGTDTTFGGTNFTQAVARGGGGGGGGGTSGGTAGAVGTDPFGAGKAVVGDWNFMQLGTAGTAGQLNASPSTTSATPSISNPRVQGAPGAPGAAGHSAANGAGTSQAGSDCWGHAGGTSGTSTPGTNGGDGSSANNNHAVCGSSGGSGAPGSVLTGATNGGRGGDGGNYGAGGGGGGPACSTTTAGTSGRGGNGGLGILQVICY